MAFKLHDTYGFPIDLTVEIAESCGHEVDMAAFDACMAEQKERARAAANRDAWGDFNNVWTALSDKLGATDFRGYDEESCEAKVLAIVSEGSEVVSAAEAAPRSRSSLTPRPSTPRWAASAATPAPSAATAPPCA